LTRRSRSQRPHIQFLRLCETVRVGIEVDGRLGSRSRGYHPDAPRPISCRPFVHRLWFRPSSPEALHVKRHERPLLVKEGITCEKWPVNLACDSDSHVNHRVLLQICNMGQTALLPLPVDFFARKIRRLRPGSNPRSWGTRGRHANQLKKTRDISNSQ
jgi:hypothetical protein